MEHSARALLLVLALLVAILPAAGRPCHSGSFNEALDDYPAAALPLAPADTAASNNNNTGSSNNKSTPGGAFDPTSRGNSIIRLPTWRSCPHGQYMDRSKRCRERFS